MKLITRDTDYAIRALCYLAASDKDMVTASELVRVLKIPRPFLRKLLQILNKKRILKSYKGRGGGFLLPKAADKILLMDVITAFQGPLRLNECFFKKKMCPDTKVCVLRRKIIAIERYVFSQLRTVTIASLSR